ncbi:DUF4232 domain-containing protein [Streptomyces sp. 900116325]
MRKGPLAAGAAVAAVAVFTVVPATAAVPGQEASSTPMCATSQLTGSLGAGDAGAGNLYRYLVLTNRSSTTCHLTGFPGVSLLDASGRQIGPAATREHTSYEPVTLKPGGSASDTVHTDGWMPAGPWSRCCGSRPPTRPLRPAPSTASAAGPRAAGGPGR